MLDDEEAVRDVLRAALGESSGAPPPPTTTRLEDVVAQGRRRVLGQRLAAAVGVVVVVGTVAFAATALGHPGGTGQVSAAGPSVGPTITDSPPSSTPADPDLLPGWQSVSIPGYGPISVAPPAPTSEKSTPECEGSHTPSFDNPNIALRSQQSVRQTFLSAISQVDPGTKLQEVSGQAAWARTAVGRIPANGFLLVDVTGANGAGSLNLQARTYQGTPAQAADASAYYYGSCTPPQRKVLQDGTVLQLFSPIEQQQEQRELHVYEPNGHLYMIGDLAKFASAETPTNGQNGGGTPNQPVIEQHPGVMPLTGAQLAQLAEELAKAG